MKTVISCKIDNLIRNYCDNFLSYLYSQSGWKRTVFETCKENFIPSNIPDEKIRILISNTGKISLTCYCLFDVLKALEYLNEQFEYGRMGYYLVMDEETVIKTLYTTTIEMGNYYFDEEGTCETEIGKIVMYKEIATLTYDKWENGKHLTELFYSALEEDVIDEIVLIEDEVDIKDNNQNEKILLSFLFIYSLVRLAQIL